LVFSVTITSSFFGWSAEALEVHVKYKRPSMTGSISPSIVI
jgi:hypothetical protein